MHSTGEHGAEGDPQEHNGSPDGTGQGAEDGAEAGNVQKLNHEQLPLGKDNVVDAVVDGDSGSLTVIRIKGIVYDFAVEQIAADEDSEAQEKANHFFLPPIKNWVYGYSQKVHIPKAILVQYDKKIKPFV